MGTGGGIWGSGPKRPEFGQWECGASRPPANRRSALVARQRGAVARVDAAGVPPMVSRPPQPARGSANGGRQHGSRPANESRAGVAPPSVRKQPVGSERLPSGLAPTLTGREASQWKRRQGAESLSPLLARRPREPALSRCQSRRLPGAGPSDPGGGDKRPSSQ